MIKIVKKQTFFLKSSSKQDGQMIFFIPQDYEINHLFNFF